MPQQKGFHWFRTMSRSEQVVAALISLVAAVMSSAITLAVAYHADNPGRVSAKGPTNIISNSTVNEYSGKQSGQSASSKSCPARHWRIGSGEVGILIQAAVSHAQCWAQLVHPSQVEVVTEFLISYQNLSRSVERNVIVSATIPPGMSLVHGSTFIYNGNHPNGLIDRSNYIGFGSLDIGDYAPGATGYVAFSLEINYNSLACAPEYLPVTGMVKFDGGKDHQNSAIVAFDKNC